MKVQAGFDVVGARLRHTFWTGFRGRILERLTRRTVRSVHRVFYSDAKRLPAEYTRAQRGSWQSARSHQTNSRRMDTRKGVRSFGLDGETGETFPPGTVAQLSMFEVPSE